MTMGMFFWVKKVVPALIVAADGSGDYTTIQAAIDALPAAGGEIHIKPGTYVVSARVNINKDNVKVVGSGKSTQIQSGGNFGTMAILNSYCIIDSIYLYGNSSYPGIAMVGATQSKVIRCWVENCNVGIFMDSCSYCSITDCQVYSNGVWGITLGTGAPGNASSRCFVTTNELYLNTSDGIRCDSDYCVITGNLCHQNGSGIRITDYGDNNIVANNVCVNNSGYGILLYEAVHDAIANTIINNTCLNNPSGNISDGGTDTRIGHNITT